jgi:hypothetical protein
MNRNETIRQTEETGIDDVRRVREQIAPEHGDDLAGHLAETNRIAEELRQCLNLGPIVKPPASLPPGKTSKPA